MYVTNLIRTNLRLRRVHESTEVPYVLGTREDTKSKSCQKIPGRQQTSNWSESESCTLYVEDRGKRNEKTM